MSSSQNVKEKQLLNDNLYTKKKKKEAGRLSCAVINHHFHILSAFSK